MSKTEKCPACGSGVHIPSDGVSCTQFVCGSQTYGRKPLSFVGSDCKDNQIALLTTRNEKQEQAMSKTDEIIDRTKPCPVCGGDHWQMPASHGCKDNQIALLTTRNKKLEGIVDKWPKTEDEVPVFPGMNLWIHDGDNPIQVAVDRVDASRIGDSPYGVVYSTFHGNPYGSMEAWCFSSTREAAERAAAEQDGD